MFSEDEFADRYLKALKEVSNERREFKWSHRASETPSTTGVRMSSIGDCARRQYYRAKKERISNSTDSRGTEAWPQMMGFAGQELVIAVLRRMGYTVFDEEKEVNFMGVIGHIDAKITGLDLEEMILLLDIKIRSIFALYANDYGLLNRGLPSADATMYLQMNAYMAAEGLDGCMIAVAPHDLGAARLEALKRKIEPSTHAISRLFLQKDLIAVDLMVRRARALEVAIKAAMIPQPEFNPVKTKFPCGFCEWKERCIVDGRMGIKIPEIPIDWRR